jgi:hypothetical protein
VLRLKEPVLSLASSPSVIWAVTGSSIEVFSNTIDCRHMFSVSHSIRWPSPTLLSPLPECIAVSASSLAVVQHDSPSSSLEARAPTVVPVEGVTQNVMTAVYKATDWGRRAVGNFLDKPSLQPPSLPTFGSIITIIDMKTQRMLCEFAPFSGHSCAAVAFDGSGVLLAAAAGDGHGVAVYSLLGCYDSAPPTLVAMRLCCS